MRAVHVPFFSVWDLVDYRSLWGPPCAAVPRADVSGPVPRAVPAFPGARNLGFFEVALFAPGLDFVLFYLECSPY